MAEIVGIAALTDDAMNDFAQFFQSRNQRRIDLVVIGMRRDKAGDAHPGHDLGIGVALRLAPAFPDIGARLVPDFLEMLDDCGFDFDDARGALYARLGQTSKLSINSPKTSSCICPEAALPMRTGTAP